VVIGARRLKAARLAELESVPVQVVRLTDAEAIEAQKRRTYWTRSHPRTITSGLLVNRELKYKALRAYRPEVNH
jgi:hypothetical protein